MTIPPHLLPIVREHLLAHTAPGRGRAAVPVADDPAAHLRQSTLCQVFYPARKRPAPDLRFHDLRHTGAVLAAQTGATLAELMGRLGHSTPAGGAALPARRPGPGRGDRRPAVGAGGNGGEAVTQTEAATAALHHSSLDLRWWLDLAPAVDVDLGHDVRDVGSAPVRRRWPDRGDHVRPTSSGPGG